MVNQDYKKWVRELGIDSQNGFICPLILRFVNLVRIFTPGKWPKTSIGTDVLILIWWGVEILYILMFADSQDWKAYLFCGIFIYRIVDMILAQTSILIGSQSDWASSQRLVLLMLLNAIELMVIYGVLYWIFSHLLPTESALSKPLKGLFESFYFSVVTATTLGYGTPHPTGWLSRSLSMAESIHLLLIIITVIAYARSSHVCSTASAEEPDNSNNGAAGRRKMR